MSDPISPDTRVEIETSAHLGRHQWTTDPQPVLDELDSENPVVVATAAHWAGFHEHIPENGPLVQAIIEWVGPDHPAIEAGRKRAATPRHGAP